VDYLVQVEGSDVTLRVTTPVTRRLTVGESVGLTIDRAACIALPADEDGR
jgi:hypothetical protein